LLTFAVDSSFQRILEWLDPPAYAAVFENSQEQHEDETAQWIFNNPAFVEWKASKPLIEQGAKWKKMPPWVLWVHGQYSFN